MCKGCLFYAAPSAALCRWLEVPFHARVPYSAFEHMMMTDAVPPHHLRDIAETYEVPFCVSSIQMFGDIQAQHTMEQVMSRILTQVTSKEPYKTIVKGTYCHYLLP